MRAISAVWFRAIMKWQLLLIVLNFSRLLSCFNFPLIITGTLQILKKANRKRENIWEVRQKKENYGQLRYYRADAVFRHERDAAVSHLQVIVSVWAETGLNLEDSSQKNKNGMAVSEEMKTLRNRPELKQRKWWVPAYCILTCCHMSVGLYEWL